MLRCGEGEPSLLSPFFFLFNNYFSLFYCLVVKKIQLPALRISLPAQINLFYFHSKIVLKCFKIYVVENKNYDRQKRPNGKR